MLATQVNTPDFDPSQTGWYLIQLPWRDVRLSWPWQLVIYFNNSNNNNTSTNISRLSFHLGQSTCPQSYSNNNEQQILTTFSRELWHGPRKNQPRSSNRGRRSHSRHKDLSWYSLFTTAITIYKQKITFRLLSSQHSKCGKFQPARLTGHIELQEICCKCKTPEHKKLKFAASTNSTHLPALLRRCYQSLWRCLNPTLSSNKPTNTQTYFETAVREINLKECAPIILRQIIWPRLAGNHWGLWVL